MDNKEIKANRKNVNLLLEKLKELNKQEYNKLLILLDT